MQPPLRSSDGDRKLVCAGRAGVGAIRDNFEGSKLSRKLDCAACRITVTNLITCTLETGTFHST